MRFSLGAVLTLGTSVSASAIQPRAMPFFPRQLDYSEIPSSCSDICYTVQSVFTACQFGTATEGCLQACRQEDADNGGHQTNYDNMIECLTCSQGNVTDDEVLNMEQAMDQLETVCADTASVSLTGDFSATRTVSSRSSSFAFPTGSTSLSSSASSSANSASGSSAASSSASDASSTSSASSASPVMLLGPSSLLAGSAVAIGAGVGTLFLF
ncbi:hypothetical protein IAR50_006163 [Cryptococcus sp. DSM 104548]